VSVSVDHYENFPVASVLCPARIRPAVVAIYGFARTADDIADEGDAAAATRLADLAAYRADLDAVFAGRAPSPRWARVFAPLASAIAQHRLPIEPLAALLSAFMQDVQVQRYADREAVLDYCRRSADPVGRLLLHLNGVDGAQALRESDAICTALQLINFWQDLGVDAARDRLYVPAADLARHGVTEADLLARRESPRTQALVADLLRWAVDLMHEGAPLVHRLPGRAGWELRLVVQGGLRIAERIAAGGHRALTVRPTLRAVDAPLLLWRALRMRPSPTTALQRLA
jgi:squalene synthase HpnC